MLGTILDDAPTLVLIRYLNLNGALVLVTATETGLRAVMAWRCAGCLARSTRRAPLDVQREAANRHAATCRALPPEYAA
jgi:hypothetical protein